MARSTPERDTQGAISHQSLTPTLHDNGFVRLLSCFGLFRERNLPNKNFVAVNSIKIDSASCREYGTAATKLLRDSSRSERQPVGECTEIKHIRQLESWDCGIACVQMALRWLRSLNTETDSGLTPLETMERKMFLENADTTSIWTVDLLMLLEQLLKDQKDNQQQPNHGNTTYLFSSEVLGVNASHSTTGYYEKSFASDSARVSKIFDEIIRQQLPILCPYQLEFSQMLDLVSFENCVAIVLVDNSVLMESVKTRKADNYAGHYVILCGISCDPKHIEEALSWETDIAPTGQDGLPPYCLVLANPGIQDPVMYVTPRRLERAWTSEGTDKDVIFIAKHENSNEH